MGFLGVVRRWALCEEMPIQEIAQRTGLSRNILNGIVKLLFNNEKLSVYVYSCGEFTGIFVPQTKCVNSVLTEGCCVHLMTAGAE